MKVSVFGIARSGTTAIYSLLQEIMSVNHGKVQFFYEPFFWDPAAFNGRYIDVNKAFRYINSISTEGLYQHLTLPLLIKNPDPHLPNPYLNSIFQPESPEKNILCKFIRANGRLRLIRQISPGFKFIYILRNPLDSVNSLMTKFSYFGGEFHKDDYPRFIREVDNYYNDRSGLEIENTQVARELQYWYQMNLIALETFRQSDDHPLMICYESFVENPGVILRQICQYLGYEFRPEYQDIVSDRVGDITHKFDISNKEMELIEPYLGKYVEMLTSFGIENNFSRESVIEKYSIQPNDAIRTMPYYGINPLVIIKDKTELKEEMDALLQSAHESEARISGLNAVLNSLREQNTISSYAVQSLEREAKRNEQALQVKASNIGKLESEVARLQHELSVIQDSLSWTIGKKLTTAVDSLTFFIPPAKKSQLIKQMAYSGQSREKGRNELLSNTGSNRLSGISREKKINLGDQIDAFYGNHRSGWSYAVHSIKNLHSDNGVYFDTFIERTFYWSPNGIQPHKQPWVGVIHVPPVVPKWFQYGQSNESIFNTQAWKESYPFCRGLYTLSVYHMKVLQQKLDVPVNALIHPTEFPETGWSISRFLRNKEKKVIQVGWWLRRLHSIYLLPVKNYQKIFLRKEDADLNEIIRIERENSDFKTLVTDQMLNQVSFMSFIPNHDYDQLLSENLIFMDLYDSSANNAIIECIVRNTPVLVNRLESVVEYLGEDYPLYFETLEEAARKADDFSLIVEAHLYLCRYPSKDRFTGEYFRDSVIRSEIYQKII